MESGFLSFCRQCRRIRLFVNYSCASCETEHSRRLRDKKRLKDDEVRDTVLRTQERLCPQCREMVPLSIITEREMLGLLARKYPGCSNCDMDLSDESIEVTVSMFNDMMIFYSSFKFDEPRLVLGVTELLRHFKGFIPSDEKLREDFLKWKEWALSKIVENVKDATPPARHSFGKFLEDFKRDPSKDLGDLVKANFKNIDLKLELLSFFNYKEDVPPEKEMFLERLDEVMSEKTGVKQEPVVLPALEMYRYEQVFTQILSDGDEDDDDDDEYDDEEDEQKKDELSLERRFIEVELNLEELAFKTRSSKVKKEEGVEKQIVTWHAALVIDNVERIVFLYRPEGFSAKDDRAASFESKKVLSSVLKTQADHGKEQGDIFSEEFFNTLPPSDICYIAVKLGKPYLADYDYHDIVFGAGERRDFISSPPEPEEGFSKPEPRDMMVRVVSGGETGEKVNRYRRVGICEKCLGITRPYLREKWECPECGSRDSAKEHYCSGCMAEIQAGDVLCNSCAEHLI